MPRPIEALIHVDALAHNLARARRAAPDARVWAVIKANAYGHGIERVFEGLRGADGFALLDLAEAERVRALGWRGPVLLLEGCFEPRDLELCSRLDLWHTVHHEAQVDWLAQHKTQRPHHVYLKLNSGMNRLGFKPAAFRAAWRRLSGLTQVDAITLMTHFANADAAGSAGVDDALAVFEAAVTDLPGERSLCNSAATLRHAPASAALRGDWVLDNGSIIKKLMNSGLKEQLAAATDPAVIERLQDTLLFVNASRLLLLAVWLSLALLVYIAYKKRVREGRI